MNLKIQQQLLVFLQTGGALLPKPLKPPSSLQRCVELSDYETETGDKKRIGGMATQGPSTAENR
jgi:hypothetical protein